MFSKLPHINFLNLDIEGLDKEVILNLDLEKYKPDVIVLEDNIWGGSEELNRKMNKGRSRLNCTAKDDQNNWRWFGHQFYF